MLRIFIKKYIKTIEEISTYIAENYRRTISDVFIYKWMHIGIPVRLVIFSDRQQLSKQINKIFSL